LNAKSDTGHVHDTSDVTGLHDMLAGKSDVGHDHDTRYYTKTNLSTSGQSSVHWNNITNEPAFITGVDWDEISGDQSDVDVSGFNNDAGYLTSLPSHNHDTRYLKLTGGSLTGDVTFNASTEYANVTDLGFVAPIKIPEFRTTENNMFVPFLHTTTRVQSGYCKHVSLGSFRTGGTNWNGGIYFAQGGNDNYPTEYFLMEYGGNLKFINSSGTAYKFYNENFKPQWNDIGNKPTEFPPADHDHFNQDLNTTDRVKFDGIVNQNAGVASYHYRNVASKAIEGFSNTGTMKITMPQSWSNTKLTIKIAGFNYSSTTGWWECIVNGYNYTTESKWYNPKCELRGNPPFSDVRLAHDGTKCCLLLGNTSTTWSLPNIQITDVITGYRNIRVWSTGWSIDLITNESGISNIATPDVDRPWHSGNLDPSDYYTKTQLQTSGQASVHAGNINSGTLSNSRLSFNPDYFVQGTDSYRRADYNSTNALDDNNASGFFRLDSADPANPDGIINYYGFRIRHSSTHSVELVGRAAEKKLWFGGLDGSSGRQPWREIWHGGNLDTANIVRRNVENVLENTLHVQVWDAGDTTDGIVLYNNSSASGTAMEIGFNYSTGSVIPNNYRSAKIVAGLKYDSIGDPIYNPQNSSISLYARPDPSFETASDATEPIFEAGFKKQQAFVKYHNNPPVIHSEYGIISSDPVSQTLNPTKGVYLCGGSTLGQEIILGTTGVENGQTVKILKASNLLARVRYGAPGNYQWRAIGHSGAAEFIHYNGEWFCFGAEWEN
ncbi:MAG: phage tail repeat domain-containing protein, partial [Candidatus Riflebacteria bacterium]|nr:phage tail repeat domain-containing protein [Candidatus Riflebacteria bacterium]